MLSHEQFTNAMPYRLAAFDLPDFGVNIRGKVRDIYCLNDTRVLIATDRLSAFDQILGLIPFKGQVINQMSAWWFKQTQDIIENHVIAVPDPNVTIAREAQPIPIEVIVRGYITGVTSTSLWTLYAQGERKPYGVSLPDGLRKNDPLPLPIITPTTKAKPGEHDQRLTPREIRAQGIIPWALWEQIEEISRALFARGQLVARWADMILVDTKYEFGLLDERLVLIDEIHTPDSSRFWSLDSYTKNPEAPEHFDKEHIRLWFAAQGYRGEGTPPPLSDEVAIDLARRYITIYEAITQESFVPGAQPPQERIMSTLTRMLPQLGVPRTLPSEHAT